MDETKVAQAEAAQDECLSEAVTTIFKSTCGVQLQQIENDGISSEGIIVAVISLIGDLEWTIYLGLPGETAVAAVSKFAGFEVPFDSEDMGDAVGELANILAGEAKANLDRRGVKVELSLPSVIRAENMEVLVQRNSTAKKTCFESELGKLWTGLATGKSSGFMG